MTVQTDLSSGRVGTSKYQGLDRETLILIYRTMFLSRRLDDREIQLKRQSRSFFQISSAGHEAVTAALGLLLRPACDWLFPHYRDRALCLMLGETPEAMLLQAVGSKDDPSSAGRQMPCHWGNARLHIVSTSSPTGTRFLPAVGAAEATLLFAQFPEALQRAKAAPLGEASTHYPDEIVCVASGEGATSEGEFWEAINAASAGKLPLLFLVEDNGYAISVPVEVQTPGGSISGLVRSFPGLYVAECDGTDPLESYAACRAAVEHCRMRLGPALVHARVVRLHPHSLSDDDKLYKTAAEREAEAQRDPISKFGLFLVREGLLEGRGLEAIEAEVEVKVREATDRALAAVPPAKDSIPLHVYSEDVDPASSRFETQPQLTSRPLTMVEMVSATLADEMARDPRIVVFGQDVADCSREESLKEVKGKGGVFKATAGLQRRFGGKRVYNAPIAEASIVGRALGLAARGMKPVVEIQFFDYIWPAMMQFRDELSVLRWRSAGTFKCPAVIRAALGGYLNGGGIYHSQCGEVFFTHMPGIRVVMPSTALDLCGLLRTAIRCDDPVLFLEHKHLYRQPYNRSPYPGPDFTIPFGKARLVKEGSQVSIVTYGAIVHRAELAAAQLEREGISTEVLDLRSLSPYDWDAVVRSVKKTHRVIVAYEDMRSWGYGAEIAARVADELFDQLDAPVKRVAALDAYCAYNPLLENAILPQVEDVAAAVRELAAY